MIDREEDREMMEEEEEEGKEGVKEGLDANLIGSFSVDSTVVVFVVVVDDG